MHGGMGLKEFEILLKELKVTYGRAITYEIRNISNVVRVRVRSKKKWVFFEAPMVSSRMDGVRDMIPYVLMGHKVIQLGGFHKYVEAIIEK